MPYLAGFGGQITVNNNDSLSLTVNITGAAGAAVLYADATRTTPVNFPDLISGTKTYYSATDGGFVVSVKFNGVEIAGASSTTVPVTLVGGASYSFQPSIDSAEQAALIQQSGGVVPGTYEPTGLSDSTLSSLDGRYQQKGTNGSFEPAGLAPATKTALDSTYQPKGSYEPSGLSAGTKTALSGLYAPAGSYEPTGLSSTTAASLAAAYQPKGSYEPAGLGTTTQTALDNKYVPKTGTGSLEPAGLSTTTQTALDSKYIPKSGVGATIPNVPASGRSGRRTVFGYDKAGALQQFEHQDLSNPGYVNVLEYGCDNTGSFGTTNSIKAANNDSGFATAIAAARAAGKGIYIPRGVYNTTTTVVADGIDVKGESSRNNINGTVIQQDTSGTACTAIMTIGGNNAVIEGIYAMHFGLPDPSSANLTDEKSSGFWIIRAGPVTTIRNLFAYNCGWGFYCGNLPAGDSGVNFMYSCTVDTLRASRCNRGGGRFSSFNAGNTGSNFSNLYFANDGACTPANVGTSVQTAWYFGGGTNGGFDELIVNQINAEWFSGQNVIVLDGVSVARIHGLHVEGWVPTGSAALMRQTPSSLTRGVEYGEVTFKRWLLDTGYCNDFAIWDGSRPVTLIGGTVNMNGPDATASGLPAGTPVTTGVVPPIRRHRWSTGSNGSLATYSGSPRGSSLPTLANDSTQTTGMGIQVVDRFASATTLP